MSSRFLSWTVCSLVLVMSGQVWADALPAKDSTTSFSISHSLGFSDGTLYLYTGDSIYAVDRTNPANPSFTLHMTGLESAFAGGTRSAEGVMATGPGGKAMISFGYTNQGVLSVDLQAKTTSEVTDYDTANVFSLAVNHDGQFFGQWADTGFPASSSTRVDHIDPVTLDVTTDMADPGDLSSGGMTFLPNGDLIVGTFDYGTWPDPIGTANFYRITASDIAQFLSDGSAPALTSLGGGGTNGNGTLVADASGNVYINTSTGIGRFDPDTGVLTNLVGDIADTNIYTYDSNLLPYNGLAYDESTQELIFAELVGSNYELASIVVPEPAAFAVLLCGGLGLTLKRRRH